MSAVISAPREELFDFVADLSNRPSYTDHYLEDFRLARANPVGKGAAARFLLDGPMFSERGEFSIAEATRPRRIVEEGRVGRLGRSRLVAVYDFIPEGRGVTRVELTTYAEPKTLIDRFKQRRVHRWMRRQTKKALERLRRIFEEPGREERSRVAVAGDEPWRAPRFGAHVPARATPNPALPAEPAASQKAPAPEG